MGDQRRSFSREFTLEAVRLVTEGGLSLSQAAWALEVGESVLGRRKKQLSEDPEDAFPGKGHLKYQDDKLRILRWGNEVLRGAALLHWAYYAVSPNPLNVQAGYSRPQ